mgnify:CR=1 FL=1
MAEKFTSSNSTVRAQITALKEQKRIVRDIEAKMLLQAEQNAAQKKLLSDHRIATKMARINGTEPPAPLQLMPAKEPKVAAPEPVAEPEAQKPAPKKAAAKKPSPKKAPRKKKDDT